MHKDLEITDFFTFLMLLVFIFSNWGSWTCWTYQNRARVSVVNVFTFWEFIISNLNVSKAKVWLLMKRLKKNKIQKHECEFRSKQKGRPICSPLKSWHGVIDMLSWTREHHSLTCVAICSERPGAGFRCIKPRLAFPTFFCKVKMKQQSFAF